MRPKPHKDNSVQGTSAFVRQLVCLTFGCCYLFTAATAMADEAEEPEPVISGKLTASVQLDHIRTRSDSSYVQSITEPTIEAGFIWRPPWNFRVHAIVTLGFVKDTLTGWDNRFEGLGLLSDEMYPLCDSGSRNLFIGKRDVAFGLAPDEAWGLYGTDLIDEFGIESMLTLGAELTVGDENSGELAVGAAAFMTGTAFLSDLLITQQGRTKRSDGGLSVSVQCAT